MARQYDYTPIAGGRRNVYDAETGTSGTMDVNPDGTIAGSGITSNFETKRDRLRGLGELAANRAAPVGDFSAANADRAKSYATRAQQQEAAGMLRDAALGNAPSRAAIMGNQAAGQSLEAALGASAGARGLGAAAVQQQAQRGQVGMQGQALAQFTGMRASENATARSQYGAGMSAIRGNDYDLQGLSQQQAAAQAAAELAQRRLNQAGQLGFEQLGINAEQIQVDQELRGMGIQAKENDTANNEHDARAERAMRTYTAGASAIGSGGASLASKSDERTKQDAKPLSFSAAQAKRDGWSVADLSEAPGTERHYDRDVSRAPDMMSGASLSGPTPKYSSEPAPKAGLAAAAASRPRKMSDAELKRLGEEMLGTQQSQARASLDSGPSVKGDDMGKALADMQPYQYEYRPEHAGSEGQAPGEKNVGPMAQDMAKNPITGSAVERGPDGLLRVDLAKASKLSLGGLGYLAAQQRQQAAEIAALKKGRA